MLYFMYVITSRLDERMKELLPVHEGTFARERMRIWIQMINIFKKITNGRNAVITAGMIYTFAAIITVASAWVTGLHRFDLWLSISRYVALRPWTAILYFFSAVAMALLVIGYLKATPMPKYRKVLYLLIIMCICGCAVFPSNPEWSGTAANIHNWFAYSMMVVGFLSFITLLFSKTDKRMKIFGIVASAYATFFIIAYAIVRWSAFWKTMFIWENIFIYLFQVELWLEGGQRENNPDMIKQ